MQHMQRDPKELANFWSRGARAYLLFQSSLRPLSLSIVQSLRTNTSKDAKLSILDIACGAGEPSTTLAQTFTNAHVTATDFAPGMIEVAEEYAAEADKTLPSRIKYAVADAQDLSAFESGSFDVVTCVAALFMIPDPQKALRKFKRVLKPGGQLFVTVWSTPEECQFASSAFLTLEQIFGERGSQKLVREGAVDMTDPKQFEQLFPECGFSKVEVSDFNLVFQYKLEEIESMRGHPMMVMGCAALVGRGKSANLEEAWSLFWTEYKKCIKQNGYLNDEGLATFPTNVAHVAHAIA